MPVSIVVGGQYGSESKGKVALEIVRRSAAVKAIVRVGGTNSGHIAVDKNGVKRTLRQLPAGCIDGGVKVILPPGSYINPNILLKEIEELQLTPEDLIVSPMANVITPEHIAWENDQMLNQQIGSTQSGTGASVLAALPGAIHLGLVPVKAWEVPKLYPYIRHDTTTYMRQLLDKNHRIIIEGTQGFGLCLTHGGHWPMATSRGTTAGHFLSEAGLACSDVDDVTMVIRCHPIRVAGNSGPLPNEIDWEDLKVKPEFTTVTQRMRRVAEFDAEIVIRAIAINQPTRIVLNHLDYIDPEVTSGSISDKARNFVEDIEAKIGQRIDWVGISPERIINFR